LPLAGEIVEFNDALEGTPEAVNADPYGAGWIKIKVSDVADYDSLLSDEAYKELIGA
jgi:glycine cleavage system H protein